MYLIPIYLSFSFTFAARNEKHENRSHRRGWFSTESRNRTNGGRRAFTSIPRVTQRNRSPPFFFFPFPSKITHARINLPRVLRCYVANLFHARSSLPKINPLAITSRAQAKRYKPLCARTRARVTSHFANKTHGIVSAGWLFKRIASPDIASNIFNALLNNPPRQVYTTDYRSRVTVYRF